MIRDNGPMSPKEIRGAILENGERVDVRCQGCVGRHDVRKCV